MKTLKFLLPVALVFGLMSCEKKTEDKKDPPKEIDTKPYEDVGVSMNISGEITSLGEMSLEANSKKSGAAFWASCASFTIDTTSTPSVITLDFGPTNCQGTDGNFRRGKLLITYENNPFDPGAMRTITSQGFAVNDYEVIGGDTVTFEGFDANGDPYATIIAGLQIIKPNGDTIIWNTEQTRVWTDGFGNFDPNDNSVEVSGTADGVTANGLVFDINIIKALRVEATCAYIVSGTFDLSGPTFPTLTYDYGNGVCDNQATITLNGVVYPIVL